MSNVTVFNPQQVPDFVRKRAGGLTAVGSALAGGFIGGKRISIKGGVFRLMSGGKEITSVEERFLDVIIVNAAPKVGRTFFLKKYDGDAVTAPDCWSPDGEKPSDKSAAKQSETCRECPKNIKGSGENDMRACRFQQRLAVVLANDVEGDVLELGLPATSIFPKEEGDKRPLQAYARWLAAQNVDATEVVTRLRFDTKSESPKLFFQAMRWLTDEEHAICVEKGQSADAKLAITMDYTGQTPSGEKPPAPDKTKPLSNPEPDEPPAPPPKKATGKKPTEAPKPPAVDEEEAETDPPAVRKQESKPNAVPEKKSLSAMIDDWDAE